MFARVFALLPLALVASASHLAARDNTVNSCNTGDQYCCDQVFNLQHAFENSAAFNIVDAVVGAAAHAGIGCSLISLTTCSQQPTCCTGVKQNGLINVGCTSVAV